MSLYAAFKGAGPSGFGYSSTAEQVTDGLDLEDKTFLLTGCNSGIGLETLRVLALRGGHVIAAARSEQKAAEALAQCSAAGAAVSCELSDPASVRGCVAAVQALQRPLDAIICNAGIMALPQQQQRHGWELQLLTNHVGHFILVTGLLDALAHTGRVVMVSSAAHKRAPREGILLDDLAYQQSYSPWRAYGQSKLANLLFARQLAARLEGSGRTANACHPGVIKTNLGRHMNPLAWAAFAAAGPLFLKTMAQGAATQCYLAAHPTVQANGLYFADCNPAPTSAQGQDDQLAHRLWQASEALVASL